MPDAAEEEMPDVALEAAHSASEEASKTADGSKGKQTMKRYVGARYTSTF